MPAVPLCTGRPTWAEVDLGALVRNFRALGTLAAPSIRRTAGESGSTPASSPRLMPVVKADAYGHGATDVARALGAAGAEIFAVAFVEEGAALRRAGITAPILVLEGAWPGQERWLAEQRLIPAVQSCEAIGRLDETARALGVELPVHLKIDTGMTRLGVRWNEIQVALQKLAGSSNLRLAGTFTHLAAADEIDSSFSAEQIRRFESALSAIRSSGRDPGELHIANSAGWLYSPELRGNTARLGIALYGYPPAPDRSPLRLEPVLTLKSRIGRIQSIAAGEAVGYNRRFVASRPTLAATIPVGYADGYRRNLSGSGKVIVRDTWAPLLGAVSMDLIVADVTDIPRSGPGDEVILLGASPNCRMDAFTWAELAGTIPYEILCGIGSRVPRIYT